MDTLVYTRQPEQTSNATDTLLSRIRQALCQPAFDDWGTIKRQVRSLEKENSSDKELLVQYLQIKKINPDLQAGDRLVVHIHGTDFFLRYIPAGTFWMGAGVDDIRAYDDEKPQREVTLTQGFWMMETPVTQRQYQAIIGENPSHFKEAGLDAPVERVSWFDAAAFANKLSALENSPPCFVEESEKTKGVVNGSGYIESNGWRLPTEAEWEYACRAGTTTPRYGDFDKIAWYYENSGCTTHPVGRKAANAWGLYDTLGNVWEWCCDAFGSYEGMATKDPLRIANIPIIPLERVFRGGCWQYGLSSVRVAFRNSSMPSFRETHLGFRLCFTDQP